MKAYLEEWHKANPHKSKEYYERQKLTRDNEAENERKSLWKKDHPEYCREYQKQYAEKNKGKIRDRGRLWVEANRERKRETTRLGLSKYRKTEKAREWRREFDRKVYATKDGRLNLRMACGINSSLKPRAKGGRKWESLVGYTLVQLKQHFEKQFTGQMTWENYGTYWWIDHKIPIKAFNFEKPEDIDFKKCWALKNLQPLEKIANIKKRDKVDRPYQPSLAI